MAFDDLCRLTLSSFRSLVDDSSLTHFFSVWKHVLDLQTFSTWMQIIRQQRDWNPKSVESRADTLSVRLWGLLRAFPSLFTLQRSIHCNKTEWLQWMLCWSVEWHSMLPVVSLYPYFTLEVIMLLWLHFFRLGARLGSSTFLTKNSKVMTTERIEPPIFWFEVRRLIR